LTRKATSQPARLSCAVHPHHRHRPEATGCTTGPTALQLEAAINRLDRYDLLILDDLSCVHKDHAETFVLFELIGARHERRSMLITANQPFADWDKVFPDHAMMIAAIDRLVHHAIIFEMNVESYRRRGALDRKSHAAVTSSKKAKNPAQC
jgi:IstB-like ATP binding protein